MWWYVVDVIAGMALGYVIARVQHYRTMCKVNAMLSEAIDMAQGLNDAMKEPVA